MNEQLAKIQEIIKDTQNIVVIQADNPDGDSLGSALAMEEILAALGKDVQLYCGVDIPGYLRYMTGWDRVQKEMPKQFDASVIVDASTTTLLEKLTQTGELNWLATRPCIVLDHHESVENVIPFATVLINDATKSSAGELIYSLAKEAGWQMNVQTQEFLMAAIMGDTQGLSNQLASPETFRVIADMVEAGVDRIALDDKRRDFGKMPLEIFKYKAALINRAEHFLEDRLAIATIPQQEINIYSPLYNPAPLIQTDMLQTAGVGVAIVLKQYDDGRVTGAIRCNNNTPIGADLAASMGGGGHVYASGFKDTSGRSLDEIKQQVINTVADLIAKLEENETS